MMFRSDANHLANRQQKTQHYQKYSLIDSLLGHIKIREPLKHRKATELHEPVHIYAEQT